MWRSPQRLPRKKRGDAVLPTRDWMHAELVWWLVMLTLAGLLTLSMLNGRLFG
jgi:hypothetical protein